MSRHAPSRTLAAKEQAQMAARRGHFHQMFGRRADQTRHREQLIHRNHFVMAGRQQTDGCPNLRQVNALSKGDEAALRDPVLLEEPIDDLKKEASGQVDRLDIPLSKTIDQFASLRGVDICGNLQSRLRLIREAPESEHSIAMHDTLSRPHPFVEHAERHIGNEMRQLNSAAAMSIGAPTRTSRRTFFGNRAA